MTTTPALNEDLVREITAELLAHGEFSHIPGNNRPNAELAAKAILEIVGRHQSKEIEALRSALEPSAETKAAYSGEFYELVEIINPNFDEDDENEPYTLVQQVPVSWTTIKEIMAAIRARTALKGA